MGQNIRIPSLPLLQLGEGGGGYESGAYSDQELY